MFSHTLERVQSLFVSNDGGLQPIWRRDGREIFYLAPDRRLVGVSVQTTGNRLTLGARRVLFQTRVGLGDRPDSLNHYDISADSTRFLVASLPEQADDQVVIVMNWTAGLEK